MGKAKYAAGSRSFCCKSSAVQHLAHDDPWSPFHHEFGRLPSHEICDRRYLGFQLNLYQREAPPFILFCQRFDLVKQFTSIAFGAHIVF